LCDTILLRVDRPDRAELRDLQDHFNNAIFEAAVRQGIVMISPDLLPLNRPPLPDKRRSLTMLRPNEVAGLRREEAIQLIEQLQEIHARLDRLRSALRRLADPEIDE
jgi:hypothetical protein